MTRVLLVHGAFHGAWCWTKLLPELADRKLEAEAVELPFTGAADDRQVVKDAIARLSADGAPVVVVGHSLGGAVIRAAFYHRCSLEDAAWATAQLRPMPLASLMAPMDHPAAWRDVPSTYVLCADDQTPFLACPGELADAFAGIVERIGGTL